MLADVQSATRVEGQQAVVDPLELSRTMELLGLRDDSQPSGPATAEPDAGMGFDAFVQTIMQRQDSLCEQERRWGGPEPIPVLELFPMMARAYDVRRAVDRSGAGEPQAGSKAAARAHAPRKARLEQPGAGRKPSATPTLPPPPPGARGGAQLSPGPGAASEARSVPRLRGELPTGGGEDAPLSASSARSAVSACTATGTEVGRRGGIFWGVFNSYGETYASYKQLRAEYEARWLDENGGGALGGCSPVRAGAAAASAAAEAASGDSESAEEELASVFLGTTKREAEEDLIVLAEPAPADNLGRRRVVGGPLPRSLALLGTPAAAAAAAVTGSQGRAGGGTAREEEEGQLLRAASSGHFTSSPPGGGATQHGRRRAPAAVHGSSRSRNGLPHSAALGSAAEEEARFGESREPQLPVHHAKHVARSRVLPSLELPQAGMGRRKPAGEMEACPRLRHVQPARNTEHALGKEAMQARMRAWHDMRMSTLENGPMRERTIRMGRLLRQRERIYLAHINPLPVADDGVHEFFS